MSSRQSYNEGFEAGRTHGRVEGSAVATGTLMAVVFRQAGISLGPGADAGEVEQLAIKLIAQGLVDAKQKGPCQEYWSRLMKKALEQAKAVSP